VFDAGLTLLYGVHYEVVEGAASGGDSDVILVVNDTQISQSALCSRIHRSFV
jgi:hypothetical protein